MVREIERFTEDSLQESQQNQHFPDPSESSSLTAPAGNPVFYRTYSRRTSQGRESWDEVCSRTIEGLTKLGKLNPEEIAIIDKMQRQKKTFPSGRWLWVGGTPWLENPNNFSGGYNCTSTNVIDWRAFGLMMDLAMMGCGTGAILEPKYIQQLPVIKNRLKVSISQVIGITPAQERLEETQVTVDGNTVTIKVGDSRQGWVKSYQTLLELSSDENFSGEIQVNLDLSDVRPAGESLSGFGGVANPVKLPDLYGRCADILNKAIGRKLNSVECCLLIDEAAVVVVAGNVRRCIAYGERVSVISGMKPIQDIAIGELVLTSSGEYKPVTNKFLQGIQDVVEIRTPETSIRCTANHRVAVYDGLQSYTWKYAGELQPGDRLISVPHRKGMPCSTADYAWLVGFFIGDGHADIASLKRRNGGGGCVAFAFSKARLNSLLGQKCLRILRSMGYTPSIKINENHAWIIVHRKELGDELIEYKQPWATPVIPEFVWLGTEEIRGAFLAGLADADAGPSRNVLLHSNKIEFLRQVQRLALSLGIATTLHERSPKMLKGRDTIYEGCHWLKIRGIQSQVNAVALLNPQMGRAGFQIYGQKKNGLSLPHQFIEEAVASGWRATTIRDTKNIVKPSHKGGPKRDANWDTLLSEGIVNPHWLPLEVQLVVPAGQAETFDIEVESDREFIASGLLVHNSAGMRQFAADDELGSNAKDNLWQQDENGNWRIDPERDALRMANHTRVFHHKPTLEESIAAVQKQYYSGEGAIQWAGEAVARANADILDSEALKREFIATYEQGIESAIAWLKERYPDLQNEEIKHRLERYGLNPCLTADTWVHTENGARQIKDLIGKQQSLYVNGELFSTTPEGFFFTGVKPVLKLQTKEGYTLRLTGNHQLLKVTAQTQKSQYTEWVETENLQVGDRIVLHNHRGLQPWQGEGTFEEGWLVGSSVGWVSLRQPNPRLLAVGSNRPQKPNVRPTATKYKIDTPFISQIERASYQFYQGFLRGIFNSNVQISTDLRLFNDNIELLAAIQRILLRLGIFSVVESEIGQLAIANDNLSLFAEIIGFQEPSKAERLELLISGYKRNLNRERFTATITAILKEGVEGVYDCTVPAVHQFDANGLVAHNCGEIIGADFHCVSGDTMLITKDGMHQIRDLVDRNVEIWNGKNWSQVVPVLTGKERQLYRVSFGDGTYLDVTEKHRFFVKDRFGKNYEELTTAELAQKLKFSKYSLHTEPFKIAYRDGKFIEPTWAYTLGQLVGDGSICQSNGKPQLQLRLYGAKREQELTIAGRTSGIKRYYTDSKEVPCLLYTGFQKNFDPLHISALKDLAQPFDEIASWDRESILHFIAGLADADGSEVPSGGIRIYLSKYDRAYRVYLLLLKCGIRSSVNLVAKAGDNTNLGARKHDLWYLQITDCAAIPCQRLDTSRGHQPVAKGKWQIIDSVAPIAGLHDTFCFNESEFHKGVFGGTLTGQCNLAEIHLNQLNPDDAKEQEAAFTAGALAVATLLNHQFQEPRYQSSRELDPIVGVSFTGLFDFFVTAFGVAWLKWWEAGRPDTAEGREFKQQEVAYLTRWKEIVHKVVWEYCDRHGIKRPNRCTTLQPAGTKSLLTGASPGWHPPKAQRFIRRITFAKNDPVALACLEYGYGVVPAQSDKDEKGNLLDDPFDPRCTEWLVEIPVEVPWANLPGASEVEISKFSALAQMDFYLQVQRYWTTHNTSATVELTREEVEALGERIYQAIQNDEGYISVALLARFEDHQSFPRLPFEPISKETYHKLVEEVRSRRQTSDFYSALLKYDNNLQMEAGPAGCDSDKCMFPDVGAMQQ